MVKPASVFSSVTAALVLIRSAVSPAFPSCADKAIEKQPACAAAINSSGFVPLPSSKRVLNEYCVSCSTPLCEEIVPRPSFSPPFQTADALRFMLSLPCSCNVLSGIDDFDLVRDHGGLRQDRCRRAVFLGR